MSHLANMSGRSVREAAFGLVDLAETGEERVDHRRIEVLARPAVDDRPAPRSMIASACSTGNGSLYGRRLRSAS